MTILVLLSYVVRKLSGWTICMVVDAGLTTPNMDPPDNYQTKYDSKTKIVVFYSLIHVSMENDNIISCYQLQEYGQGEKWNTQLTNSTLVASW